MEQYNLPKLSLWKRISFFEQFHTYLGSSIPLSTALTNMIKYSPNREIKVIAHILLEEIDRGENFSDAILKFKNALGGVYCNLMSIGAQSGELPKILKDIHSSLKKQRSIIYTIIKQCAYPAFIFFIILVPSVLTLLLYIVPRFSNYYQSLLGEVPANLQAAQTFSAMFTNNWFFILTAAALFIWGSVKLTKSLLKSELGLSIPLIGKLIKYYNLSLFTKLLAIAYSAGIPITHGILISSESLPNQYIQKKLFQCSSMVTRKTFTETFASTNLFSPEMITKIQAGELTGELDNLLNEISNDIDEAFEIAISAILKLIEPVLMVIMAIFVGMYAMVMVGTI